MATAKTFEAKLTELLEASPVLQGLLAKDAMGHLEIHVYESNPVGNHFPQLTWNYYLGASEEVLPAEKATLVTTAWTHKTSEETALPLKRITDEVDNIINNNPQIFLEIENEDDNDYGLRVVQLKRTSSTHGYDSTVECYFRQNIYAVVKDDDRATYTESSQEDWDTRI